MGARPGQAGTSHAAGRVRRAGDQVRRIKGLQDIINKHKAEYKDEHLLLKEEAERQRDIET